MHDVSRRFSRHKVSAGAQVLQAVRQRLVTRNAFSWNRGGKRRTDLLIGNSARCVSAAAPEPEEGGHGQGAALIDLHTHTTASDGRCTPAELVARAAAAGVTVLSVTDHDTVAGYQAAAAVSATAGVELVPGIEITAIVAGADVHVLGYFIDVHSPRLLAFLAEQRRRRIDRVRQIFDRLAAHGVVLDSDAILQPGLDDPGITIGRPWIARALVAGGTSPTATRRSTLAGRGRPAFVRAWV